MKAYQKPSKSRAEEAKPDKGWHKPDSKRVRRRRKKAVRQHYKTKEDC